MTRTQVYRRIVAIRALDKTGDTNNASALERDLIIDFLREAEFANDSDSEMAQMILKAMSEVPDRVKNGPCAD